VKRNLLFLALLLSVGVNCGLLGMGIARHRMLQGMMQTAREADARPPGREGRDGARLADRLELSGEAREGFLRLQRELADRVRAGRRKIDEARRELRRELTSPEPDRARVEELLSGVAREQDALDRALVANVYAARELLDGPAEREYLRFVERFGAAVAGPRPPGPPPERLRPFLGGRRFRGPAGREGSEGPEDPAGPGGPPADSDRDEKPVDRN
jgi:Spy/CpxP family protein refolding chaperone